MPWIRISSTKGKIEKKYEPPRQKKNDYARLRKHIKTREKNKFELNGSFHGAF